VALALFDFTPAPPAAFVTAAPGELVSAVPGPLVPVIPGVLVPVTPGALTSLVLAGGAAMMLAAFASGQYPTLRMFSIRSSIAILYLAVLGSVVAYTAYNYAQTKLSERIESLELDNNLTLGQAAPQAVVSAQVEKPKRATSARPASKTVAKPARRKARGR